MIEAIYFEDNGDLILIIIDSNAQTIQQENENENENGPFSIATKTANQNIIYHMLIQLMMEYIHDINGQCLVY